MREIKFRAWDKERRVMLPVLQLHWDAPTLWIGLSSLDAYHIHRDKCDLMQFTGLKDKNDTEIYEGDKLQESYGDIGIVYWKESAAGFYVKWGDGSDMSLNYGVATIKSEIIGNIHENPELLKG